jgi:signal transduction histidine kinase
LQSYRGEAEVHLNIPKDLKIFADDLIGKVFLNLYQNALMHGERVTRIDCWTRMEDDSLLLFFADDGIGIRAEDKEKLFDRGFGRNTGQGLFLAREVLDLTGMRIDEVGESGKGAMFRIRAPPESVRHAGD